MSLGLSPGRLTQRAERCISHASQTGPGSFDRRTALANETIQQAKAEGTIKEMVRLGEPVAAYTADGELVSNMSTLSTEIFGNILLQAVTKPVYAGKLDTVAGGGLHLGEKKIDVVAREAQEEASIPLDLSISRLQACETVSYHIAHSFCGNPGSYSTVLFVCEMEQPESFVPKPNDGEVDEFITMTESQVMKALDEEDFKPTLGVLWVGHFYQHGIIDADNEPYLHDICMRFHRKLDTPMV